MDVVGWGELHLANQLFACKSIDKLISESEEPEHRLKKTLGPWSLTALGIGAVIGSGIFTVIGTAIAGQKFDTSSILNAPLADYMPGLRKALVANPTALDAWKDITPLARNEFICWVEDAKQEMTRERRIRRTQEELEEGQRRPCCWPGCKHRERNGR